MNDETNTIEPASEIVKPIGVTFGQAMLPGAILLAAVLISASLFLTRGAKPSGNSANTLGGANGAVNLSVSPDDRVLGDPKAKVTMYEFSDFECPFCRRFYNETFGQIKRDYIDTGKVKIVYRHMPLSFHPGAPIAAQGSECAADQGKFWEFHDAMFQEQSKLNPQELVDGSYTTLTFGQKEVLKWAGTVPGIDTNVLASCLTSGKYKDKVNKEAAAAISIGVNGTPTFVVNGQLIVGAQPYEVFKAALDAAL
jgi:protein-disulfide isomerase